MTEHNWIKILLTPFSWLYGGITLLRNFLYDQQILKSGKPTQFSISVGNLTVGGTGKTPMIEYLVRKLNTNYKIAILSRGYGRTTKGPVFAGPDSAASDIGDEPLQYYQKYVKTVIVAVSENRINGAKAINIQFPERNLLLLDDAFQHRPIAADIQILLNDYNRPFYDDLPFPAGRLRETRSGAGRADAVVVTKCPVQLPDTEKELIRNEIKRYSSKTAPIFFASVQYAAPVNFEREPVSLNKVKVVAGIASPLPFLAFIRDKFNVTEEILYPDHHNYTLEEAEELIKNLKNDTFVLTTEKDMVKLKPLAVKLGKQDYFAFLPIETDLGSDAEKFDLWLNQLMPG